jgi:acetate kinase
MRALLEAEAAGDDRAGHAVELFIRSAAAGIAAAATALTTLDTLVFTGGIGENAAAVRDRIVARLAVVGVRGLLATPPDGGADHVLTRPGQAPAVLRIVAREDLVIADATRIAAGPARQVRI